MVALSGVAGAPCSIRLRMRLGTRGFRLLGLFATYSMYSKNVDSKSSEATGSFQSSGIEPLTNGAHRRSR